MTLNKKTFEITCEGAVEHVKEILRRVKLYLDRKKKYNRDTICKAISDGVAGLVDDMCHHAQNALIGCYGLNKIYDEYRAEHGGYNHECLSELMCYRILYNQFRTKTGYQELFKADEIEVVVKAQ
jgi:hypothetical protein